MRALLHREKLCRTMPFLGTADSAEAAGGDCNIL